MSRTVLSASILAASLCVAPALAHADDDEPADMHPHDVLRSGTHRAFAQLGLGFQNAVTSSDPLRYHAEAIVGWHFRPLPRGPAIAGVLTGSLNAYNFASAVLARFQWDFQPVGNRAFFITPFVQAGGALQFYRDPSVTPGSVFHVVAEVGLDLKLAFADRGYVMLRPIGLVATVINSNAVGYEGLVGGGVLF